MSYQQGANPFGPKGGPPYGAPPPGNPYASPQGSPYGPGSPYGAPLPPGTVKNYLVESILLLICCSQIFGIIALIYAGQVNGKLSAGDYRGAVECSENAKKWCLIGLCVGIVCNFLAVIFGILSAAAG